MWWRHCMDNSSDILVNLKGFLLDNWLCSKNNKNIYESSIKCTEVTSIQNMPQRWQSNWVFYKYFERCCCLCLVSSTRSRITFCQIGFIRWKPGLAVLEVMGRESWVRCLEFKSNNRQILDGKLPLFVLKWAIPSLFFVYFRLFKQTLHFLLQNYVKMSIQYTVQGFEPTTFGSGVSSHNH